LGLTQVRSSFFIACDWICDSINYCMFILLSNVWSMSWMSCWFIKFSILVVNKDKDVLNSRAAQVFLLVNVMGFMVQDIEIQLSIHPTFSLTV
jgi:hypothetical protein